MMKDTLTWSASLFMLLISLAPPASADIYRYVEKDGTVCFTNDIPAKPNYELFIKERKKRKVPSTSRYDKFISEASQKHGVSFAILKAIVKVESDFNPTAVSKKGAMGLMQIMPENFKSLRVKNPFNPRENIMAGAWYFKQLLNRFDGKLHLALAAYNAGPDNVSRSQTIPPIRETELYVKKVIRYYNLFKKG
ncbi:MAG: lytic transglycosylase domain-containing protein [Deltaproteobacteria bacterium]|jgi:soluble lytic murein transglycosylase-like protein|nr:lytic transglycosylase domain-containing protein [Deltaproteobacteria bacterium]MBN2846550.1 lytic transglycosylase domain-containing protein [Deltaproteobacteria bacterium]